MICQNKCVYEIPTFPYEGEEKYLYFSYSLSDYNKILSFSELMVSKGFRIKTDRSFHAVNWVENTVTHIDNCEVFVCFLSEAYLTSKNASHEFSWATRRGKTIVPVFLEEIDIPESYLFHMEECNFIQTIGDKSVETLYNAIMEKIPTRIECCRTAIQDTGRDKTNLPIEKSNVANLEIPKNTCIEESQNPYEGNKDFVFISYDRDNKKIVYSIIEEMDRRGLRVWSDQGIHSGDQWRKKTAERIRACKVFVCFISKEYVKSGNCFDEVILAAESKKIFVPIMLDHVSLPDDIALPLSGINRINAYKLGSKDEIVDELCLKYSEIFASCSYKNWPPCIIHPSKFTLKSLFTFNRK